jgi:hypothetical protein
VSEEWVRCETGRCCEPVTHATDRWLLCTRHAITYYGSDLRWIGQEAAWEEMRRRKKPWLVMDRARAYVLSTR